MKHFTQVALVTPYNHSNPKRVNKGLSLIEFLVCISIIGIISTLSVPSFVDLINKNRLISINNDLMTSLALARQKSITFSKDVYLCELVDEKTCNESRPFNANWTKGWMVFIDDNKNAKLDEKDTISYVSYNPERPRKKNIAIVFNQRGRLRFRPDGSSRSAGFYICTEKHHKHIFLLYSGRARHNEKMTPEQIAKCRAKLV